MKEKNPFSNQFKQQKREKDSVEKWEHTVII